MLVMGLSLGGCLLAPQVPEERIAQALKLVDQGAVHLRMGKLQEASTAFSLAAELAPLAAAVDGQGCVALLQGDFSRAENLFTKAYQMDNSYDEVLANLALLKDILGQKEKAKDLYNQSVKLMPASVPPRNNKAVLEYEQGQRKIEVLEELEKAGLIAEHGVVSENVARLKR
jgi:Flp pilus assembly protein TadD